MHSYAVSLVHVRLVGGAPPVHIVKVEAWCPEVRELLDLRYVVERQRLLSSAPGKPGNVDFYASTMKVELALLHEEDLLRFLSDLRQSGNAFYAVRKCALSRTGQAVTGTTMTPRLRGDCDIDLITVIDRAAKQ